MLEDEVMKMLNKKRKEQEFFRQISVSEGERTQAAIDLINHELKIIYIPDFLKTIWDDKTEEYLKKRNLTPKKALETELQDLFYHELGHRGTKKNRGCPRDFKTYSELFLNPLQDVTHIKNKQLLQYFANILLDIIDNTLINASDKNEGLTSMAGFYLFLKEQGKIMQKMNSEMSKEQNKEQDKSIQDGKFTKLYEAYARLNLYFNGSKAESRFLNEYFTFDPGVNTAIQNFLRRTGISDMKEGIMQGSKRIMVRDKNSIRRYLKDDNNWKTIARIFGEEFGKLLKKHPVIEILFGAGGSNDKEGDKDKFNPADGFGEELNDKSNWPALMRKGNKAGNQQGWMTDFEYLISLYEMLAKDKLFEMIIPKMMSKKYPLIDLGEKVFKPDENSARDIIGVDFDRESKGIELTVGRFKYDLNINVNFGVTERPKIVMGIFDTSGSMQGNMPEGKNLGDIVNPNAPASQHWCYNSKYHCALIAYFMIVEYLKDLRMQDTDVYFANFSNETRIAKGLEESKKQALHPQFGGTTLDIDKLRTTLTVPGTLSFTISDGEIGNDDKVLEFIVNEVAPKNPYFHVQIGNHSNYSRELIRNDIYVKQVKKEEELYKFVIDLTDRFYRQLTTEPMDK